MIDQKNLSYLRSARRLNSRQAWWALLLATSNLHSSPGRQFTPPVKESPEETVLPSSCGGGSQVEGGKGGQGGPGRSPDSSGLSTKSSVHASVCHVSSAPVGTPLQSCISSHSHPGRCLALIGLFVFKDGA